MYPNGLIFSFQWGIVKGNHGDPNVTGSTSEMQISIQDGLLD